MSGAEGGHLVIDNNGGFAGVLACWVSARAVVVVSTALLSGQNLGKAQKN